eukprot:GHVT01097996.1.p1 GENE.GHVT01097996.1~~GHVT01097996.1.p1  ORF type:complete len:283 (+),score=5.51 GHVT01097996.1:492-1340(+)
MALRRVCALWSHDQKCISIDSLCRIFCAPKAPRHTARRPPTMSVCRYITTSKDFRGGPFPTCSPFASAAANAPLTADKNDSPVAAKQFSASVVSMSANSSATTTAIGHLHGFRPRMALRSRLETARAETDPVIMRRLGRLCPLATDDLAVTNLAPRNIDVEVVPLTSPAAFVAMDGAVTAPRNIEVLSSESTQTTAKNSPAVSEGSSLPAALNRFRQGVIAMTRGRGNVTPRYDGWPPARRIRLGNEKSQVRGFTRLVVCGPIKEAILGMGQIGQRVTEALT